MLTEEERKILQQAAREAIEAELSGRKPSHREQLPPSLTEPRGVFVSLHKAGRLRGCIGYIEPIKPLMEAVQEVAAKAAFDDPRFPPLGPDELRDVVIEISVLSPLERVTDIDTIELGKHGLLIELAGRRGLLLPQVATEFGWDRVTFLQNAAQKAGLPHDAWRNPDVKIYKFFAEVFGEDLRSAHTKVTQ